MTDSPLPASSPSLDHEAAVAERYGKAAKAAEPALCCPIDYDPRFLKNLPAEILERDYGCGDPSKWAREGDTVVDLGSGAGKICYILAQKVGRTGRVIGVDVNDDMLALARGYQAEMAKRIGWDNVRFVKARIQDMSVDLDALAAWLRAHPVQDLAGLARLDAEQARLRATAPAVANDSADLVVSNCVLNLVRPEDKGQLFADMFRILRRGGRAVISDIVCDEDPTPAILNDPELWSGCIAGAFREDDFVAAFARAGFYGIEILERAPEPWQVVDGIEFRSLTLRAFKGKEGPCLERNQAVVYRGPWKAVQDDDGHTFARGERMAVCDKTFHLMLAANGPYAGQFDPIAPRVDIPLEEAGPFTCAGRAIRAPRVSKGLDYRATTTASGQACAPGECC